MKKRLLISFLLFAAIIDNSFANPSFSGIYAGSTEDQYTQAAFRLTPRNKIAKLRVVSLSAACVTTIPGQEQQTYERDTNITKNETPVISLNSRGRIENFEFQLNDPNRVDFQGATITLNGRVRGGSGRIEVNLSYSRNYDEDNSTEACLGSATVIVRYYNQRN